MSELIECWNCGKKFEKYRFEDPFQHTCKNCIPKEYLKPKSQLLNKWVEKNVK